MLKTIKGKLFIIIMIILIIFGIIVTFNLYSLMNSNNGLTGYKNLSDETNRISEIEMNFFEASLALKDYVITYDDKIKDYFISKVNSIKNYYSDSSEESETTKYLVNQINSYERAFSEIVSLNQKKEELINVDFHNNIDKMRQNILDFKRESQKNNVSALVFYTDNSIKILDNILELTSVYFSSKSAGDKKSVLEALEDLKSQIGFLELGLVSEEMSQLFKELQSTFTNLESTFTQIVETIESQEPIIQQMEEMRVEILDLLEEQRAELKVQQDTLGPTLIEENNTAIMLTIILTVIAFVVSIIMVIYLIRSITKPLTEFRNKINQFKEGDLTVDFESKSKDEIGQMANALSEMSKELRKSMSSIKGASEKVDNASIKLTKASQESRNNSEELKTQMDTIQAYAEETAGNVEEVTSGVDEVARAAQGVSQDAQRLT
ncbi:methyl-accepting chemotaxis protein, partial [Petrotoga sp. 9PWA.NaAc.5.4]|uniref:methyl-accepting chemotaxis protein n=1 Tax=Petrotoga sp. 9PWA.NaAc.5.4 TaxID=1434328 RepID=UPI000CC3370E